jgi:hypothetical protein
VMEQHLVAAELHGDDALAAAKDLQLLLLVDEDASSDAARVA